MIDNEFLRKVVLRGYKPWDSDTAVSLFLPERELEIYALGLGSPEGWEREYSVESFHWVQLAVHWNSFCVPTTEREKCLDGFNTVGFCKALTTDRNGSTLAIIETVIDLVVDDEVMGDLINTVQVGDWLKITNNSDPLLVVSSADMKEFEERNSDEYSTRKNSK